MVMRYLPSKITRLFVEAALSVILLVALAYPAFLVFDKYYPLQMPMEVSREVVDADGKLLRAFVTSEGRWRYQTRLQDVDSEFVKLLVAYEDQRFWSHPGVDGRAMLRAFAQLVANGRIISGASTITMQLARLLEPRNQRSIKSKLLQVVRALQIERRLSKKQILEHYLTLAPYGGNLEGIRAASLAYFGKEPLDLTLAQSALLVALPQSPEKRRPDRYPSSAQKARNVVLKRAATAAVIATGEVTRVAKTIIVARRYEQPYFAAHLARRLIEVSPDKLRHQVTLKRDLQQRLEAVVRNAARRFDVGVTIAMVLAEVKTGNILVEIGSPDYLNGARSGWIDMANVLRSPGSTLKPFIYGLAFEKGVVRPETLIMDAPVNFALYRPKNFDTTYQGEISIRRALQLSLNVPAVLLLESVGPARLLAKFRLAGVSALVPRSTGQPGLAIGLGGMGISLKDLAQLYASLANGGLSVPLRNQLPDGDVLPKTNQLLRPAAAWHVTDILSGTQPPNGARPLGIAYKTGTSYGYRDAWSIGYDGRYVLAVWVGRADNAPVPGMTGRNTAAPILFEAFEKSGLERSPFMTAPEGALRLAYDELPVTLQHFASKRQLPGEFVLPELPPTIIYPPEGARVELTNTVSGQPMPLIMKLQNGRPPFRWLANGALFSPGSRKRTATWLPDSSGFSTLTVIDAGGRAASVSIFIQPVE